MFPKIKEKLPIKTFGKEKEDLQDCGIVEFCVRGLSQSLGVQMTALTAPLICSPLTNHAVQFAQQSYSHLADLKPAVWPLQIMLLILCPVRLSNCDYCFLLFFPLLFPFFFPEDNGVSFYRNCDLRRFKIREVVVLTKIHPSLIPQCLRCRRTS